ncbi:MAG TPA: hypothetical protein VLF67_04785, partial [Candidatus Saccharimonas sp.]|nr:hypothetical protein [Candidatus Saccharimonas sp.]
MDNQPPENPTPAAPNPVIEGLTTPATPPEDPQPSLLQSIANGFRTVMGALFGWVIFPVAVVLI